MNLLLRLIHRLRQRYQQVVRHCDEQPLKSVSERITRIIEAREHWLSIGGHITNVQQSQHRQTLLDLAESLKKHTEANASWLMDEYDGETGSCYSRYVVYYRRYQRTLDYANSITVKSRPVRPTQKEERPSTVKKRGVL